ncbi:MAG: undecaprenyl-diphosphate phosphatase [Candidatus Dependentiae bacterium]|nr:undecaprenyl-diphosphate phosphatase [Candidatus Dependentiae bacterium]
MLYFYCWLIVQILLESFPISSSGHCYLVERIAQQYGYVIDHYHDVVSYTHGIGWVRVALVDHFVHGVTVFVVAWFFFSRWSFLLLHVRRCWRIILNIIGLTFVADCITAACYFLIRAYSIAIPLSVGFIVTALALLSLRFVSRRRKPSFNVAHACLLGFVQGCALLPGISRFATTYVCARWLGFPSHKSFELSWLVVWPLITVAFLHSASVIMISGVQSPLLQPITLLVMASAGVVSFYALRCVARRADAHTMWWFGLYMLVPILISLMI